jgi:hypothetical protein
MITEVRLAKADLKRPTATKAVTMQGLWRLVFWGAGAATTMLIAVLAGRGVVASQRAAVVMSSLGGTSVAVMRPPPAPMPVTAPSLDTQAETKRLADAVRDLTADNDELKSRLAAVEHTMDDVTGSIAAQSGKTAAAAASPPWPDPGPPIPATPADIAAIVAPPLPLPMEYGVDIGSALSIDALRARWVGIRSAHPQLFNGLAPTVTLRQTRRSNRPELRLVVGPLTDADAATQLCAALLSYRLFCQPTLFAGQHLALE